jgi:hypothetical protein
LESSACVRGDRPVRRCTADPEIVRIEYEKIAAGIHYGVGWKVESSAPSRSTVSGKPDYPIPGKYRDGSIRVDSAHDMITSVGKEDVPAAVRGQLLEIRNRCIQGCRAITRESRRCTSERCDDARSGNVGRAANSAEQKDN